MTSAEFSAMIRHAAGHGPAPDTNKQQIGSFRVGEGGTASGRSWGTDGPSMNARIRGALGQLRERRSDWVEHEAGIEDVFRD